MKILVDFTLDVPTEALGELREFLGAETNVGLADAVQAEAEDYILDYLSSNVCQATIARRGRPY